jgi:F-type H+-transporting ATPase subunit b
MPRDRGALACARAQLLVLNHFWTLTEGHHMPARLIAAAATCAVLVLCCAGSLIAAEHEADKHEHAATDAGAAHSGHDDHIGLSDADLTEIQKPEEIRSDLAFFTFVVFLVLLAFLWKFAWGPILAGLEKREHSIAHNIAEAQRQHEDAKQLLADYERKLAAAADEVRSLMEGARRDAERTKQEILAEAKSAAEAERERGRRDIEAATDAAEQRLAERGAALAVQLAGKIVGQSLSAKDHARLIQEAVDKFPSAANNN